MCVIPGTKGTETCLKKEQGMRERALKLMMLSQQVLSEVQDNSCGFQL